MTFLLPDNGIPSRYKLYHAILDVYNGLATSKYGNNEECLIENCFDAFDIEYHHEQKKGWISDPLDVYSCLTDDHKSNHCM
jgi:hypothetical protein